jgi:hypothetical protein
LFFSQIQDAFKDDGGFVITPGSVDVAMQLAKDTEEAQGMAALVTLTPMLFVFRPQAAGRAELTQQMVAESEGRFEVKCGISAGLFEFKILNVDKEKSVAELKEAASCCFK